MTLLAARLPRSPTPGGVLCLCELGKGPATISELAKPFRISAPAVSKHIKVLEKAGLITREKQAQWRRCRIKPQRLKEANEFIERYRKFWDESFDRLEIYLRELQANAHSPAPSPKGEGGSETPLLQERGGEAGGRSKGRRK
jgi:DNA-binding transcriptional ArsR family regulator